MLFIYIYILIRYVEVELLKSLPKCRLLKELKISDSTATRGFSRSIQKKDLWDSGTLGLWDSGTLGLWDSGTLGLGATPQPPDPKKNLGTLVVAGLRGCGVAGLRGSLKDNSRRFGLEVDGRLGGATARLLRVVLEFFVGPLSEVAK